ncbi:MAG TPA: lamin tail domain-containing protein [Longimicrobiaceae bacterium]|nr:lamin tail domain-containing protein [Longimicrobiaceae bacterium]
MSFSRFVSARSAAVFGVCATIVAVAACADSISGPSGVRAPAHIPSPTLIGFDCTASRTDMSVRCGNPQLPAGAHGIVIGAQNVYVKLTSSNVSYNSGTEIFQFDVTVQSLLNEAIGTPDGTVADPQGIQVFFHSGPTATVGSGTITVANADGTDTFTGANQPYFRYSEILAHNAVSSAKTWQLSMPSTVTSFAFKVYIETDVQYLLVINELMANPANYNSNPDVGGEWVELYNAGTLPVNLNGLVFADSAASGRRPYNVFNDTVNNMTIQPGGYFTIGNSKNTSTAAGANGGVPIDYAYGSGMAFANSLDAFKIARVYGTDTLTLDRTQYSSAAVSAVDGVARELKNPALDNSNMDGSNWASALATSVYGPGGRGTPKAQNSTYTL